MPTLTHGQWSLSYPGTNITFGSATDAVFNEKTPIIGAADINTTDTDYQDRDGLTAGVDIRRKSTITFELGARSTDSGSVRQQLAAFSAAWRADTVRRTAGAVATLQCCYDGVVTTFLGRPRRYEQDTSEAMVGYSTATCEFDVLDAVAYQTSTATSVTINFAPPPIYGGFVAPIVTPLTTVGGSANNTALMITSAMNAYSVVTIFGPITNPSISVLDVFTFTFNTTLAYDQSIVIDTRPNARTVLRNDGVSVAGLLTRDSTRMVKASIPKGNHGVRFSGIDASGSSYATISWAETVSL